MLRFLVVDDEKAITRHLTRWLEKTFEGSQVRQARWHGEALKILQTFTPNLVITDFHRPGGNGKDLLVHLRTDPNTHHVPVVLVSAAASYHDRVGFDVVLPKPCTYEQFIDAVNQALSLAVNPDIAILHVGEESPGLQYRGSIDLRSEAGRAALAGDVAAVATYGGGAIVIGVVEVHRGEFAPVGIPESLAFEAAQLNAALCDYLDRPLTIGVTQTRERSRLFLILKIPAETPDSGLAGPAT